MSAHLPNTTLNPSYINAVYYPNWKVYQGLGPSSLNLRCITHIFYAFAWSVVLITALVMLTMSQGERRWVCICEFLGAYHYAGLM